MEVFAHTKCSRYKFTFPLNLLNLVSVDLAGIMFAPGIIARELKRNTLKLVYVHK